MRASWLLLAMGPWACGDEALPPRVYPPPDELPESTALPDPMVSFFEGRSINGAEEWATLRRPELRDLFEHYIYGLAPGPVTPVAEVEQAGVELLGGKVVYRGVRLSLGPGPVIQLGLFLPKGRASPPVFLILNACGNHALVLDEVVPISSGWVDGGCPSGRGGQSGMYPVEAIVERGYALATFHQSDVDPDDPEDDRFEDGVHPFFESGAGLRTRWGRIAAWSWGLSRVVDYLSTEAAIDPGRIVVTGHSRRGKSALLAAAFDERIAIAIPHQSGTAGAALSRGNVGEPVDIINRSFPHWFNDVFPDFAERESRLPVDQHLLLAMVAPRPLLVSDGADDGHASPDRALAAVEAADVVFRLVGGSGIVRDADGRPTLDGALSWHARPGEHYLGGEDWALFMDFVDRHP